MTGVGWGGGYVTDIGYMPGYYGLQSPDMMSVACLLAGVDSDLAAARAGDDRMHYMELGCGTGLGAMIIAAGNPGWQVTAIDFNPAHVAEARRFAAEARLSNIAFIEADLSTFADTAAAASLAEVDIATMHGVWSWVPTSAQAGIVRLLGAKMRSGGMVHVSYNALPGWQTGLGLQRVIREAGMRVGGRSDQQAHAGRELAVELLAAGATHLKDAALAAALIPKLADMPSEYLAHEYMNDAWAPCYHADVAEAMAAAKLDWVASSQLLDNFPDLMLTPEQRAIYDRYGDPRMRELIKDTCAPRTLRHDVFVRGARRLTSEARDVALGGLTLTLATALEDFIYELTMPAGQASMNDGLYRPVVRALATRPHRVDELLALPEIEAGRANVPELVAMLAGSGQALLVARPDAPVSAAVQHFNAVAARRLVRTDNVGRGTAAASARLGAGMSCLGLELYLLSRIALVGGLLDPSVYAAELGSQIDEGGRERLRDAVARCIASHAGLWRMAGLIA